MNKNRPLCVVLENKAIFRSPLCRPSKKKVSNPVSSRLLIGLKQINRSREDNDYWNVIFSLVKKRMKINSSIKFPGSFETGINYLTCHNTKINIFIKFFLKIEISIIILITRKTVCSNGIQRGKVAVTGLS